MHFPKGNLRRVTWSEGFDIRAGSGTGWGKRAVLAFDDRRRCIEFESWFNGTRESRRVLQAGGPTDSERILEWHGELATSCWVSEPVRNELGLELARIETPWTPDGQRPIGGNPRTRAEYQRDSRGRLLRVMHLDAEHRPLWKRCEIWHDGEGRVSLIQYKNGPKDPGWTREFRYDGRGNVSVVLQNTARSPSLQSREYLYDDAGRLVAECRSVDGYIASTIDLRYDQDGGLIARSTVEEGPADWPDEAIRRTEETFDGIDRPKSLTVRDEAGRAILDILWTYEDDAKGNWIRKIPRIASASARPLPVGDEYYEIRREIEYAD
jgi:hypothetical protein